MESGRQVAFKKWPDRFKPANSRGRDRDSREGNRRGQGEKPETGRCRGMGGKRKEGLKGSPRMAFHAAVFRFLAVAAFWPMKLISAN